VAKRLSFHIQQNLTPERLQAILSHADTASDSGTDLSPLSAECALSVNVLERVVLPFVRQTGLINATGLSLTDLGTQFYQLAQSSPTLFPEAMHHLLYTTHHFASDKRFSWAYAKVVDDLWTSGERTLNGQAMAQLVGMVVDEAAQTFGVSVDQIAFSRDSVRGVLNWLGALEPPVVTDEGKSDLFRRRYFCPVPTFLWAVDFLYRASNTASSVRMFLTPERIEWLSKLCVLDPSGLDNVLMMAKRTSDYERGGVFDYGTEGGFGRWLLLAHPLPVPTLPETKSAQWKASY
jgi:hypothetical protein